MGPIYKISHIYAFCDSIYIEWDKTWPGTVTPMNVCYADEIPEREYEGLQEFKGPRKGSVEQPLILTKAKEGEDRGVRHVPVWKWLLEGRTDARARLPYPPSW